MAEAPKIPQTVLARLRSGSQGALRGFGARHPDANVLAAFSENVLEKRERAQVMEHLAHCPQCRDVVALARPEEEAALSMIRAAPGHRWLANTELRWAAVAASLAVVAGVMLLYQPGKLDEGASSQTSTAAPLQPPGPSRPAAQANGSSTAAKPEAPAIHARKTETSNQSARIAPANLPARGRSAPEHQLASAAKAPAVAPPAAEIAAQSPAAPAADFDRKMLRAKTLPKPAVAAMPEASNTTLTRELAAPAYEERDQILTPRAGNANDAASSARNQTVIAHAAPGPRKGVIKISPGIADKTTLDYVSPGLAVRSSRPLWRIHQGELQKSADGGHTWSVVNVSNPGPGLTLASLGDEIWAGDAHGELWHSSDAGKHWRGVSSGAIGKAGAAIVSISISDPNNIAIRNSEGRIWISGDQGKSWQEIAR